VVLRAKKLLENSGFQVRCTRDSDVLIPLEKRAEFANRHSNALFVSVHFNKSNTGVASGLETYCLAPRGVPSMDEENLSYSDYVQHPGHKQDPANVALATTVHAALVRNLRLPDRGVKRARFVVIKNITIPGILVEGGFMSGTPDAQLIASAAYRQRIAECIRDGVNRYKDAIAHQSNQKPSAVLAPDPTSVPTLEKVGRCGSKVDIESSLADPGTIEAWKVDVGASDPIGLSINDSGPATIVRHSLPLESNARPAPKVFPTNNKPSKDFTVKQICNNRNTRCPYTPFHPSP
jgi:hypothetical protein